MTVEAAFADIYARNRWNGTESRSGPGSGTASTLHLIPELLAIVQRLRVQSVLDIGCGDSFWLPDLPGYVGVDVAPEAIERSRARHPDRTYALADARHAPFRAFDLVVSRDAMQHLPPADIEAIIANVRGSRWLLASTYVGGENVDIAPGGFHAVDLTDPQYGLGSPEWSTFDGWGWTDPDEIRDPRKHLALWPLTPTNEHLLSR